VAAIGQAVFVNREKEFVLLFFEADGLVGVAREVDVEVAIEHPAEAIRRRCGNNTDHGAVFKETVTHFLHIEYKLRHIAKLSVCVYISLVHAEYHFQEKID